MEELFLTCRLPAVCLSVKKEDAEGLLSEILDFGLSGSHCRRSDRTERKRSLE